MPLEVRQIGISMEVSDGEPDASPRGDGEESSVLDLLQPDAGRHDRARLIEECVEAVLAELARRPVR